MLRLLMLRIIVRVLISCICKSKMVLSLQCLGITVRKFGMNLSVSNNLKLYKLRSRLKPFWMKGHLSKKMLSVTSVTANFITTLIFTVMSDFKILTWRTYVRTPDPLVFGLSLTVPDQSLTLKTLVSRYTRNQDVPVFPGVFAPESAGDLLRMDKVEKAQYANELRKYVRKGVAPAPQPDPAPPAPNPVPDPAPPAPSEG